MKSTVVDYDNDYINELASLVKRPELSIYPLPEPKLDDDFVETYPCHPLEWTRRMSVVYSETGMLMSAAAVIVVHEDEVPGVVFIRNNKIDENSLECSYVLPSTFIDRTATLNDAAKALLEYIGRRTNKLPSELAVRSYLGVFYRVNCDSPLLPYLASHTSRPVEVQHVFLVWAGPTESIIHNKNETFTVLKLHELQSLKYKKNVNFAPAYDGIANMISKYRIVSHIKDDGMEHM